VTTLNLDGEIRDGRHHMQIRVYLTVLTGSQQARAAAKGLILLGHWKSAAG